MPWKRRPVPHRLRFRDSATAAIDRPAAAAQTGPDSDWEAAMGVTRARLGLAVLGGCLLATPLAAQPGRAAAVQVLNGPKPGTLVVRTSAPVRLVSTITIERERPDGSFETMQSLDVPLRLVARCDEPARGCVTVGPGDLKPVAWSGMSCSAQCPRACLANRQLHGRFRFVLRSCDRRSRFAGPVFTL